MVSDVSGKVESVDVREDELKDGGKNWFRIWHKYWSRCQSWSLCDNIL